MTANLIVIPAETSPTAPHRSTSASRPPANTDQNRASQHRASQHRADQYQAGQHRASRLIRAQPWIDNVVDRRGFDPRDRYVDTYWLGVIGPTATWIMRRLAEAFDQCPDGFAIPVDALAASIGVSAAKGAASPFDRAVGRCLRFGLARPNRTLSTTRPDDLVLDVRRRLPQVPARSLRRLPEHLINTHDDWIREHHRQCRPHRTPDRRPADHLNPVG